MVVRRATNFYNIHNNQTIRNNQLRKDEYLKHYCQTQSIKVRPHNIVFTDIHTDTGIIGSRVGHGKLLSEAEKGKSLVTLEFVCRKADGEMVTPQTLKNCNKLIQKDLGITWFHMHGLRHTYGSNMIASGANYKDVQLLMGHPCHRTFHDSGFVFDSPVARTSLERALTQGLSPQIAT